MLMISPNLLSVVKGPITKLNIASPGSSLMNRMTRNANKSAITMATITLSTSKICSISFGVLIFFAFVSVI